MLSELFNLPVADPELPVSPFGLTDTKLFHFHGIPVFNLTRNILKKIFGGSQILTINATKFSGLGEIPIYPLHAGI